MFSSQDLQIISTDDNQVVAAVQDWHQNDSYNLYVSDAKGLFFTLALEDVVSSGGPEDNVMIDLYEVLKWTYSHTDQMRIIIMTTTLI